MWNEGGCKSTGPGLPLSHLLLRRARPSGADREPPVPSACIAQRKRVIKDRWVEAMYDRDALIKMQFGK